MRFTLATYGSEGDTRPFVALSRGLIDAGHDVQLFAEQSSIDIARTHGVPAEVLAGDVKSILPIDDPSRELTTKDFFKMLKGLRRVVNGNITAWMRALADDARTSDAILFAGFAYSPGQAVAHALQKRGIGLWLQPTTPTREFPSSSLPPWHLPGWMNLLSYGFSPQAQLGRFCGRSVKVASEEIFGSESRDKSKRPCPILYGISRHLVERPKDWPDTHQICGHWALQPHVWQAPDDLLEFLSAGPPPIYVGLGAASSFTRQKALTEIVSAIAGRRVVFYPGWSKIDSTMLPDNFFLLDNTPHTWLFPRVSMVIHHGGAGTTHTAARAGVPSIPLPLGGDQFFWAHRLEAAGVAPKYVRRKKLDTQTISTMIDFAGRADVRERAKALAAAMSEENGVAYAVTAIQSHLARSSA